MFILTSRLHLGHRGAEQVEFDHTILWPSRLSHIYAMLRPAIPGLLIPIKRQSDKQTHGIIDA